MPAPFAADLTGEILAALRSIERQLAHILAAMPPAHPKAGHKHRYVMGRTGCVICGEAGAEADTDRPLCHPKRPGQEEAP